MPGNDKTKLTIVGGTYEEICMRPPRRAKYGSGYRAARLLKRAKDVQVQLHTRMPTSDEKVMQERLGPGSRIENHEITHLVRFDYVHPFSAPQIFPRPDAIERTKLSVSAENILVFGMLDADLKIDGASVVYDPQNPSDPKCFTNIGRATRELTVILNRAEAHALSGETEPTAAGLRIIEQTGAKAAIIKRGVRGADLVTSKGAEHIDAILTDNVYPIGTGDVFSASFAYYHLIRRQNLLEAARSASRAVASYSEADGHPLIDLDRTADRGRFPFVGGTVYLAAPFFSVAEEWLVREIRNELKNLGLSVFSPLHDVGHGSADDVVRKDLEHLDQCDRVFAILDNFDPGTSYEIGYALKHGVPVVAVYTSGPVRLNVRDDDGATREVEADERLKMVMGSPNAYVFRDLSTALAKVCQVGKK